MMPSMLHKELSERSASRGTYWLRLGNAVILLGLILHLRSVGFSDQGSGEALFALASWIQWIFTLVLVPLTMGGIAVEKERGSWPLLRLTDLRPAEIVWQKYAAGLVPACASVLLILPAGALCYGLGGLESRDVFLTILVLGLTACQVGALALLASVLCESTRGAFLLTLVLVAACTLAPTPHWSTYHLLQQVGELRGMGVWPLTSICLTSLLIVFLAQWRVHRESLSQLFRRLVRPHRAARKQLTEEDVVGLVQYPVAWRELTRRSICRRESVRRLALLGAAVVIVYAIWAASNRVISTRQSMALLMGILWATTALLVTVQAAGLIVTERSDQTLEILLTTPLDAVSIVKQKAQAVWQLGLACSVWIIVGALASVCVRSDLLWWVYLPCTYVGILLYLPLTHWIGFIIGSRARNHTRALFLSMAAVGVIHGVPFVFNTLVGSQGWHLFLSPALVIASNEAVFSQADLRLVAVIVFIHFPLVGGLAMLLRHLALHHANQWLGRPTASVWTDPEGAPRVREDPF